MRSGYLHGYDEAETLRLNDQAKTLEALLHHDTAYPAGQQGTRGRKRCRGPDRAADPRQPRCADHLSRHLGRVARSG